MTEPQPTGSVIMCIPAAARPLRRFAAWPLPAILVPPGMAPSPDPVRA